ncbi:MULTISPECIES: hypothetical protein [Limnospira]|jgi:hypothetical protein|uniref:Uncharacterized protein n=1 Tax=Limnospira platensis NIES-46 TaxID=1236695 RepID=A0A5M3TDP4_LIMPL|nr:hypothetical protein [Arthrospira platensis]MDF2207566.1 hypothetical protein [Arthrospira platensis NCB002]MDT9182067.1 hypothetical protein [Limnospira sp. PMC 289.06]MDT9294884.1 hypothetical protein [Arthrospira platensis PCC 7345]BAI93179.1 hypothetical protein NIES39_N00620 [Arthrospira platensis NIES-39]BDT15422.1 hypothetical protein N39L_51450 [Arthrospira platensis NIES-39]
MGDRQNQSFWDSVNQKVSGLPKNLSRQASELGKSMSDQATETARKTATEVGDSITHRASEVGKVALHQATKSGASVVKHAQGWVENIYPEAEDEIPTNPEYDWSTDELYHIFVPAQIATNGGTQMVMVKTGKRYEVKIPAHSSEGANLRLKGCGLQGEDAFLILHTFWNQLSDNIDRKINNLIVQSPIHDRSKIRCFQAYNHLQSGSVIKDPPALNLLDYLFISSPYSELMQRYLIASYNSRLMAIERCMELALNAGELELTEQRSIRSTYQYLRAGEMITDLDSLTRLDAIILHSSLPKMLKQYYLRCSAMAWAMTVDAIIVNSINTSQTIAQEERPDFLSIFTKFRQGKNIRNQPQFKRFEAWIAQAEIPPVCQVIFYLWREGSFLLNSELLSQDWEQSWKAIATAKAYINETQPQPSVNLPPIEVLPGTLAESAYNSVSRGGLGLLSGRPMLEGITGLIETAAQVAIAQVALLPATEKMALGIGHDSDRTTTATGKNWQAVGSFGDTPNPRSSKLSGLPAYRDMITELQGLQAITQPGEWLPERVLSSQFNVRQLFTYQKTRQQTIKALETQMYA